MLCQKYQNKTQFDLRTEKFIKTVKCLPHTVAVDEELMLLHRSPKKPSFLMFDNNFGKCGPIFKILSPGDS